MSQRNAFPALLWAPLVVACGILTVGVAAGETPKVERRITEAAARGPRPNFLFILTDDQRWDALGCMGNPVIRTPHIDRLAADGVRFDNMFCTTSICAISRASFLTGQFAARHGIVGFGIPLTDRQFERSLPGVLRATGYRTGFVGKWGLGGALPKDRFDYFTGYAGQGSYFPKGAKGEAGKHLTDQLGREALAFLDECTAETPFFLQVSMKAPHCQDGDPWPFQPDPRYNALYADTTIPLPPTATPEHFAALPEFLKTSEARTRWHVRFETPELAQKSIKDYYRLITGVDDVVGQLMARLRARGLAENTVVVYTSDNGFYLGDHGLAGKWFMHDPSIRLPLIIHDPRLESARRGTVAKAIALNLDVAPTLLEMADAAVPDEMQGRSLTPVLCGDVPGDWRRDFFYEHRFAHNKIPQTEGVRTDRWKYTRYVSVEPVFEEMFDLEADPHETRNLASDPKYAGDLETLRKRWDVLRAAAK